MAATLRGPASPRPQPLERHRADRQPSSRVPRPRHVEAILLGLLLLVSLLLRLVRLSNPPDYPIFDEIFYVNAARVILGIPTQGSPGVVRIGSPAPVAPYSTATAGQDPNKGHPPLAKLFIALSIRLFGDNAIAWRLPAVLMGMLAIVSVYGLGRALRAPPALALLASFIFSFDNLVFVQSRTAMLDIFMLGFMLAGLWAYLSGRPVLAGAALALATLSKLTGLYGYLAVVLFEAGLLALEWRRRRRLRGQRWNSALMTDEAPYQFVARMRRAVWLTLAYGVIFLGLLWAMDARWNGGENPLSRLGHMGDGAVAVSHPVGPLFDESYPWQWLANDVKITYLAHSITIQTATGVAQRTQYIFLGAMNPFVIAIAPIAMVSAGYLVICYSDILALFALCLFCAVYLPNFPPVVLWHRTEYIYYFLPAIPPIALAAAQFFRKYRLPTAFTWAYASAVLFGFYEYFPFKDLSTWWLFPR